MFVTKKTDCSSLLKPKEENFSKWKFPDTTCFHVIDEYDVECITLYDYIEKNNINFIDFLKIDTQGNDLNVVKSLRDKISIVKKIVLEVQTVDYEIYENQSKKNEVLEYLNNNNFELVNTEKQTFGQEENLTFVNKY